MSYNLIYQQIHKAFLDNDCRGKLITVFDKECTPNLLDVYRRIKNDMMSYDKKVERMSYALLVDTIVAILSKNMSISSDELFDLTLEQLDLKDKDCLIIEYVGMFFEKELEATAEELYRMISHFISDGKDMILSFDGNTYDEIILNERYHQWKLRDKIKNAYLIINH